MNTYYGEGKGVCHPVSCREERGFGVVIGESLGLCTVHATHFLAVGSPCLLCLSARVWTGTLCASQRALMPLPIPQQRVTRAQHPTLALFGVAHLHTAPAPITSHRPSPALRANAKLMPSRCPLQMHQVQMSLFLPRVRTRSTHLLSCSESDPAANRWSRCHEALRGNARPDDSTCYPMAVPRLLEVRHARTQTLVGAFV